MKNYLKIYKNNIFSKLVCYFDDIKKAIGETKHILKFDTEAEHDLSEIGYEYADLLNWLENKETIIVEVNGIQYNLTVKTEDALTFTAIWRTSSKKVTIWNDDSVMMESKNLDEVKVFSVDFNLMDLEDGDSVICDEDLYEKLFDAANDNVDIYLRTADSITLRLDTVDSGLNFVYDGIIPESTVSDFKYILHLPNDERAWNVYVYYRSVDWTNKLMDSDISNFDKILNVSDTLLEIAYNKMLTGGTVYFKIGATYYKLSPFVLDITNTYSGGSSPDYTFIRKVTYEIGTNTITSYVAYNVYLVNGKTYLWRVEL